MWLGIRPHHSWAVCPEAPWARRYRGMLARVGSRSVSVAGRKLMINSRKLVAKVLDENVQLTEIVIV